MIFRRSIFRVAPTAFALVTAFAPLTAVAIGASALATLSGCKGADSANVKPGEMPSGQTWTGVYFHPVYGYLHLIESDNNIVGKWKRADQSAWGELSGVKQGNLLHYTWKEHKIGLLGPAAQSQGKGYFVYGIDKDETGTLKGQFGLGDGETGSEWDCVKQRRMDPDLDSINGDSPNSQQTTTGKWQE